MKMKGTETLAPASSETPKYPQSKRPPKNKPSLQSLVVSPFRYEDHAEDVRALCRNVYDGEDYLPSLLEEYHRSIWGKRPIEDKEEARYLVLCCPKATVCSPGPSEREPNVLAIGGYFLLAPDYYWIQGIRVLEQVRGCGLGLQITRALLKSLSPSAAENAGHTRYVWSCTVTANKPMRRIFQSLGFIEKRPYWLWPRDAFMQTIRRIDERIASAPAFVRQSHATMIQVTGLGLPGCSALQDISSEKTHGLLPCVDANSSWEQVTNLIEVAAELERRRLCVPLYYWCLPPESLRRGTVQIHWLWIGRYCGPEDSLGWVFVYREPLIRSSDPTVAGVIASSVPILFAALKRLNGMFPRFRAVVDTNLFPSTESRIPIGFRRWLASHWMIPVYRKLEAETLASGMARGNADWAETTREPQ
jgi:hypothetical protein